MAYSKQVELLEPIDMAEHLDKLELYLGQVCAVAGISKMQLDYWTNKAQIPTKGKKQRIYDMDAVETVMLIKQAKDKGLNLGAAIDAARRFRAAEVRSRLAAKRRCSLLGRNGVDVDAGAELEPGERRRAREALRDASAGRRGATRSAARAPRRGSAASGARAPPAGAAPAPAGRSRARRPPGERARSGARTGRGSRSGSLP